MFKFLTGLVALVLVLPSVAKAEELQLVFPQDPLVTEFSDSYGAARNGHRHQGNDLMAPKLTEVYAIADGVVVWVRDRGTAGRYVTIDHGNGYESWYMHLNDDMPGTDDGSAPLSLGVAVGLGDTVEAGQVIGWVGDSGNAEGSSPHTHFELHRNGRAIDPHPLLREALTRALEELTSPAAGFYPAI